jgi:glycosyltransferase 2 family protein
VRPVLSVLPRALCQPAWQSPVLTRTNAANVGSNTAGYPSGVPYQRLFGRLLGLRENRWLRIGLLLAVVGLAVWGVVSQWPQVRAALDELRLWDVLGAACCVLAGLGCAMLAWRALLADLGSPLRLPAAIRVMFLGQLGKYVPGAVWAVAAQVELARDYQIPRRRGFTASLVSMATTLVVALVVAGVTLPLTSSGAVRRYWWVLAITPFAIACLHPAVTRAGLNLVLRVARRPPLTETVSMRGMARALGWTLLSWGCYGLHAWLLVREFAHGSDVRVLVLSFGGYALAWSAGFLLIPFPGGIGPREAALVAVLSPVMPTASALVVALASRVVMTAGDLVWAGVALLLGRSTRVTVPAEPVREPRP